MKYEYWGHRELIEELEKKDVLIKKFRVDRTQLRSKLKTLKKDRDYYKELYEYNNVEM